MDVLFSLLFILLAILLWRKSTSSGAVAAAIGLVVFLALCLLIAYFVFDTLTGSGIDASIVYHLTTGLEGAPTGDFTLLGLAAGTMLVFTVVLSVYSYRSAKTKVSTHPRWVRSLLALGFTSASVYLNPASSDIANIIHAGQILPATQAGTGDLPDQFASIDRLTFGTPRKNFVLLYLESLERSYFDQQVFPDLMPNLIALEKEALSFSDSTEVSEAGWTIAAMVASQCGIPLTVEGAGVDRFLPGVSCLGDLLDDAGYNLTYLGGADMNFAGKGAFFRSHGFDQIKGREELKESLDDPEYLSAWGLYDDSLFDEAMQHFDSLAAADEPFGLVLLTVDTHHPFGYMSRSCGGDVYQDGGNKFLNAVHCADKMAADFIRHIVEGPFSQDTILVVMSDHMAMPNMAWDLLQETERRNLLLFFGPGVKADFDPNPGTTFDVAPTLLGLLGADKRSLGYGRDLLGSEPTLRGGDIPLESVLDEGRGYLASMWHFPEMSNGMKLDRKNDRLVLGERHLKLPALLLLNEELEITSFFFDINSEIRLIERILQLSQDQRFIWVDSCVATAVLVNDTSPYPDQYCSVIGSLGSADLQSVTLADARYVDFQEIAERFAAHPTSDVHYNRRLADAGRKSQLAADKVIEFTPKGMVGDFAVRSAGYSAGDSWILNRDAGERIKLIRGLTLLGLNADEPPVKIGHKDTCSYGGEKFDNVRLESDLQTAIDHNKELYGAFVIVAHNSMVCYEIDPNLELLFSNSPFEAWRDLWYEQPYVAVISGNGQVQEFVGERQTAMGVELLDFIEPREKVTQRALRWLPRVAHAGGGYNGLTYTNSLDALDANAADYELFEIDLLWTSDGKMVCLHDWEQPFLAPSGVIKGEPLSLAVFEAIARQHTDFQPCTLDSLTVWLRDHPDVRIVLDVKGNVVEAYRHIAEMHPDLQGRFIPQI